MHYYKYHPKSLKTQEQAGKKYPWLFEMDYSDESREVRYYLLEYLGREYGYSGALEKDENGKPIPIMSKGALLYWSISHSTNYLAFIVSDKPTGIDIIENREREISLLDTHSSFEYDILGGKNWNNFYILWTAKESIIKADGTSLDEIQDICLQDVGSHNTFTFVFHNKTFRIQTVLLDTAIISHII